ncbi:MAG: M23 family metallopeptidase [Bacteroidales bacterium]|nr:M23 family metallopeptidase [Bacteroidales bacterium]
MDKKKKSFLTKWRHKYRLILYNDNTFEEVLHFRLSRWNVALLLVLGSFFIVILTTFVIAYTPLREYIPGYPDADAIQRARYNKAFIDSIEEKLQYQEKYLNNLKYLILYGEPINKQTVMHVDTTENYKNLVLDASPEDSSFRKMVEQEEKYSLSQEKSLQSLFVQNHYFIPVKGIIVNKFNKSQKHYGIDIVTKSKDMVFSILDGQIVYAGYTSQTGYMVIIQHRENLLSIYKHMDQIFTTIGQKVNAGEVLGIVGNTGELTTGPHLHFELWYKGQPLNPENIMTF